MRETATTGKDRRNLRERADSRHHAGGAVYPFAALVGQDEMKLALLLCVIDPHIGGVLIMGERGTGKSTAVRALADLLPRISRVKGCVYGCDPAAGARAGSSSRLAARSDRGQSLRDAGYRAGARRRREGVRAGSSGPSQ